tara:strand:+ start:235 stop:699 length:465 start_codon:yes stop_codon:yes gene_type:complete
MSKIWGPSTWFFLHNLVENIDENKFNKGRIIIWNEIFHICSNLPCVYCSDHAKKLLRTIDPKTIKTKQILKELLYRFHNVVNNSLKKEKEELIILDKYVDIKLSKSFTLMINSWARIANKMTIYEMVNKSNIFNTIEQMKKWIVTNKSLFTNFE